MLRSKTRGLAAVVFTVATSLVLSACALGTTPSPSTPPTTGVELTPLDQLQLTENPRDYVGPSTALLPTAAIPQLVETPTPQLPVTVISKENSGDVPVEVRDVSRVLAISLSGNLTATVFGLGLGDHLVGRDVSTDFEGAEHLPVVTHSGHSISSEAVVNLAPSLVITDGSIGPIDVILQLRDAGIPVVFVEQGEDFESAARSAQQVADALGVSVAGQEYVKALDEQIDGVIAEIAKIAPSDPDKKIRVAFLYIRGTAGIYYLFGKGSGADTMIEALGAIDVATEADWEGMRPMNAESFIALNPDLIILMTGGLKSVGGVEGLKEAVPAIALTKAGSNNRFVDMADSVVLSFGPRTPMMLHALAISFYAPGQSSVG
ncbi:MAG: ABC transporter substrate-binding protein [Microbacteriaceae bacterium]|nr:ABC transporter substrate-binding protein [Microbacteriaceae bacterium]